MKYGIMNCLLNIFNCAVRILLLKTPYICSVAYFQNIDSPKRHNYLTFNLKKIPKIDSYSPKYTYNL